MTGPSFDGLNFIQNVDGISVLYKFEASFFFSNYCMYWDVEKKVSCMNEMCAAGLSAMFCSLDIQTCQPLILISTTKGCLVLESTQVA